MRIFGIAVLLSGLIVPIIFFCILQSNPSQSEETEEPVTYQCKSTSSWDEITGTSLHTESWRIQTTEFYLNNTTQEAFMVGEGIPMKYEESLKNVEWNDWQVKNIIFKFNKETLKLESSAGDFLKIYYDCTIV